MGNLKHKEYDSLKTASSTLVSACGTLSSRGKCREDLELSRSHLPIVIFFFWVVYSRVADKPHFRSKCKHSSCGTNEQSVGKCLFLGCRDGVICPVPVSRSSPVGSRCPDRHLDLFAIRTEHLTLSKNFNGPIKHITTLEPGSKLNIRKHDYICRL